VAVEAVRVKMTLDDIKGFLKPDRRKILLITAIGILSIPLIIFFLIMSPGLITRLLALFLFLPYTNLLELFGYWMQEYIPIIIISVIIPIIIISVIVIIVALCYYLLSCILVFAYDRFGGRWTLLIVFLSLFAFLVFFLNNRTVNVYTDKKEYCVEEPVRIYISRDIFSDVSGCKLRSIKRRAYKDGATYHEEKVGYVEETARNYQKRIDFLKGNPEMILWDQNDSRNDPSPAVPSDYFVFITCIVIGPTGNWGGFEKSSDFRIRLCGSDEPCKDKGIKIIEAYYDSRENITLKIKNTGASDTGYIGVYMGTCTNPRGGVTHVQSTNKILDGIKSGETKEYKIKARKDCYDRVLAHVFGCSNENSVKSEATIPNL